MAACMRPNLQKQRLLSRVRCSSQKREDAGRTIVVKWQLTTKERNARNQKCFCLHYNKTLSKTLSVHFDAQKGPLSDSCGVSSKVEFDPEQTGHRGQY